jgi:hypothetical protein
MKRRLCAVGFALLAAACVVSAQSGSGMPSKDEVQALLARAYNQANLWADGAAPFHLRAKTKSYGAKGAAIEGTYELWWSAKDRWSEEIIWNGQTSSQIVADNQLWRAGEDTHRADSLRLTSVLKTWQGILIDMPSARVEAGPGESRGHTSACLKGALVSTSRGITTRTPIQMMCVDTGTGSLVDTQLGAQRWEYRDYTDLGSKRYPRKIHFTEGDKPLIEVDVDTLELADVSPQISQPPTSGAAPFAWCSDMIQPIPVHFGPPSMDFRQQGFERDLEKKGIAPPIPREYTELGMLIFSIDHTGRATDVRVFLPGGPRVIDKYQKRMMMLSTFKPATCQGSPVPGEFVVWQ